MQWPGTYFRYHSGNFPNDKVMHACMYLSSDLSILKLVEGRYSITMNVAISQMFDINVRPILANCSPNNQLFWKCLLPFTSGIALAQVVNKLLLSLQVTLLRLSLSVHTPLKQYSVLPHQLELEMLHVATTIMPYSHNCPAPTLSCPEVMPMSWPMGPNGSGLSVCLKQNYLRKISYGPNTRVLVPD